jgi:hypothetical protein
MALSDSLNCIFHIYTAMYINPSSNARDWPVSVERAAFCESVLNELHIVRFQVLTAGSKKMRGF